MSMFICRPEHIGLLCAGISHYKLATADPVDLAAKFACENIESAKWRYPRDKDGERSGPMLNDEQIVGAAMMYAEHYRDNWPEWMTTGSLRRMAECYSYQACEHPDWTQSEAMMLNSRAEMLPDSDAKVRWEFTESVPLHEVEELYAEHRWRKGD